ncbi:hypothetical protein, partial [Thiolapillus sp.]
TPRSEAYFVFPLAQGTPGKQCGLAATGVYQPSLRSPWLAAIDETLHDQVRLGWPLNPTWDPTAPASSTLTGSICCKRYDGHPNYQAELRYN